MWYVKTLLLRYVNNCCKKRLLSGWVASVQKQRFSRSNDRLGVQMLLELGECIDSSSCNFSCVIFLELDHEMYSTYVLDYTQLPLFEYFIPAPIYFSFPFLIIISLFFCPILLHYCTELLFSFPVWTRNYEP